MSSDETAGLEGVRASLRRARRERDGLRRYRRGIALVTVLALLGCAALIGLTLIQGARMTGVQLDVDNLVTSSGQRLVFSFNQVLDDSAAVTATSEPEVALSVQVSGRQVIVTTAEPLDFAVDYTVTLDGLSSTFSGAIDEVSTSFQTPPAELIGIRRGGEFTDPDRALDQIVVSPLSGSGSRVVFEDPAIQEFVLVGDLLLVATVNPDGSNALWLVDEASRQVEQLALPGVGIVGDLQTAPGSLIGFSYTSMDGGGLEQSVQFLDLAAGRELVAATGVGGAPVQAVTWTFLGGTSQFLVHSLDTSLTLLDARNPETQLPLGQFSALYGVSRQGDRAVVGVVDGRAVLTLADRSTEPLTSPEEEGVQFFDGETLLDGQRHLSRFVEYSDAGFSGSIRELVDGEWSTLYRAAADTSIDSAELSGNGQFLLLGTSAGESGTPLDGYPAEAHPLDTLTLVVDARTGEVVKTMNAVDLVFRLSSSAANG